MRGGETIGGVGGCGSGSGWEEGAGCTTPLREENDREGASLFGVGEVRLGDRRFDGAC